MSLSSMSRVYNMSAELWWRWNQEVCYWITPSVQGHLLGSYNFLLVSTCCNLWSFIFLSATVQFHLQRKFNRNLHPKSFPIGNELSWEANQVLVNDTYRQYCDNFPTSHHITKFDCKYRARPHTTMCSKGSCQGWEGKLELHWDICARQWVVG